MWPTVDGAPQMSMHLDLEVDDLDEALEHALSVGAALADVQPQETVRVMLDPAEHPFCRYLDTGAQVDDRCGGVRRRQSAPGPPRLGSGEDVRSEAPQADRRQVVPTGRQPAR